MYIGSEMIFPIRFKSYDLRIIYIFTVFHRNIIRTEWAQRNSPFPYLLISSPKGSTATAPKASGTGRGSSIGSVFAWHASGPKFDPHVRHILSWRLGHENISTTIPPLPLIQEEQLSVTGERICTKYW